VKNKLKIKSSLFWEVALCSPLKVNQHFRVAFCLHLHGQRESQGRNKQEADGKQKCVNNQKASAV
jgi:hypothetical protein